MKRFIIMAKRDMARLERPPAKPNNEIPPVPEFQGKAKKSNQPANPIISGTSGPNPKVFHTECPILKAYLEIDNDLAWDNMENDLPDADLQNL